MTHEFTSLARSTKIFKQTRNKHAPIKKIYYRKPRKFCYEGFAE